MSKLENIEEKFVSKKQARYFYAKANDKSLSKSEREKWQKWADEFSEKTNFKKIPKEAKEEELDEIVDAEGNIARSSIPIGYKKVSTVDKATTDDVVKKTTGAMGLTSVGLSGLRTMRYWGESDMSKLLGFDAIKKDMSYNDALKYIMSLGIDKIEAEERLKDMGYIKGEKEKINLIESENSEMKKILEKQINAIIETAKQCNINKKELISMIKYE